MTEPSDLILYADDNKWDTQIIRYAFEQLGHKIEVFVNGKELLAFIQTTQSTIRLIICDVNMPEMSAYDVLPLIKPILKEIPVVILTSSSWPEKKELFESYEKTWYFEKPYSLDETYKLAEKMLSL